MPLTPQERTSFTAPKLAQLDRMDAARLDEYLEPTPQPGEPAPTPEEVAALRAKVVGRWANSTPAELRARVNVLGMSGETVNWAPENDYSVPKQRLVESVSEQRSAKWGKWIPRAVSNRPLKSGLITQEYKDSLAAASTPAELKLCGCNRSLISSDG